MEADRFWELVDLLGGVADERTVPAIDQALAESGETEEFLGFLQGLVDDLLARCPVPNSHEGDTADWIAAAVVAAGRATYERSLAAGLPLDPDAWRWADAERLLVAGLGDEGEHEVDDDLGVWLQWKSATLPAGVTSAWTTGDDLHGAMEDDDPSSGRIVADDPAWRDALGVLRGDAEFRRRRQVLDDLTLHLVVRDVDEWLLTPWPSEEQVEHVVLTVPADAAAAAESRTELYLDAVVTLVTSTQQQLGLDDT